MSTYLEDLENAGSAVVMGFRDKSERFPNGYLGTYVFKTVEDAMRITEKEHKRVKRLISKNTPNAPKKSSSPKEEPLPAWFDKELEKEDLSQEESAEMSKILGEIA
jgi:hypothetical protein